MEKKQAEKEMDYRIGKIVLATMLSEGLLSNEEYDAARENLMNKLNLV